MKKSQFSKLLAELNTLTSQQLEQLQQSVTTTQTVRDSLRFIEQAGPKACPHCGGVHVVKNGTQAGLQRYLCRACGKSFNPTSSTPLSRLRHKDKFERYAQCLKDGLTVREAAWDVGVCVDTAFRWRHRFLQNVQNHQPTGVSGILEVDETWVRRSEKGCRKLGRKPRKRGEKTKGSGRHSKDWVPVLVGRARGRPHTVDKVLDRVTGAEVTDALKDAIVPGETVLCTDGHSAYLHLQRTLDVQTKSFKASAAHHGLDKVYHVQSANNYHERLKTWINRGLRGVATKYLPNYLAWQRLVSWDKTGLSTENIIASAMGKQIINV